MRLVSGVRMKGAIMAVMLGAAASAQAQTVTQLNMGGSTTSSGYFPYYSAVANAISNNIDSLNVTLVSPGGFVKNQTLMMSGELDFGGITPALIADAESKGFDKFRVLWWVHPAVQNIMARRDANISDVSQLDGKCFHPGMNGSSGQKNMLRVLQALDIEPELYLSDPKDAINAIKNGRCLGQMKAISGQQLDGTTAELNLTTPMWPVGYTDEQMAKIKEAIPWMSFYEVPEGIVEGAPSYSVHAIWIGFAATSDMNEETGYKIVKGMYEGLDDQRAALKAIADLDIARQTVAESGSYLHAGAVKFYRELGIEVPGTLVPPEAQ